MFTGEEFKSLEPTGAGGAEESKEEDILRTSIYVTGLTEEGQQNLNGVHPRFLLNIR